MRSVDKLRPQLPKRLKLLLVLLAVALAAGSWRLLGERRAGPGRAHYAAAAEALKQGDSATARDRLQQAILLEPANGAYHAELGGLSLQQGDAAGAAAELQAAAYLAPDEPHVFCRLAQALVAERRRSAALAALDVALRKTPDCPLALSVRGEQLLRDDNLAGALQDFERVARLEPGFALAYQKLGYIHLETQRYDEALKALERGLAVAPRDPGMHVLLSEAYAHRPGDPRSLMLAEQHLRVAIPGNPEAARAHALLGKLYLNGNRLPEARAEFQAALRLSPYLADALYGLAQVARRDGHVTEARRLLKTFNRIQVWTRELTELQAQAHARPDDVEVRLRIARMQADKAIDKEALKTLDSAVAIDPARREPRALRASIYQRLGQHERAAREFAIASRLPGTAR